MDPKKQNLTPELKQIYDRVMNTQVAPKVGAQSTQNATSVPQAPAPPAQAVPTPVPESASSAPIGAPPPVTMPPIPGAAPAASPAPQAAPPTVTLSGINATPQQNAASANNNQNYLSSVPPRPVSETKPFVFTGNKVQGAEKNDKTHPQVKKNTAPSGDKKISMPIIGALVAVLIVVWGIFWAKILGLF